MALYDFTFYDLINRNARIFNDQPAWYEVDEDRTLSFGDYKTRVDRLAQGLRKAGIKKGDRLGVLGKNSSEFFLLYGAAAALGAIVLPVNWRLAAEEVCFNLNDGAPAALFVDAEYQAMIAGNKTRLPSVTDYYNLKADTGDFRPFSVLSGHAGVFDPAVDPPSASDGFVIIHTAAVGGRPRGALLSQGNILCSDMHLIYLFGTTPKDVHLNLLPLFHIAGLVMVTSCFHVGAQSLNMSRFDAAQAVELIHSRRAGLMFDFSPILASLLDEAEKTGTDIGALRGVLGLDTPETIERYQKMTGGTFYGMYGQTETSCLATLGRYDEQPGAAGKTILLADVGLVDEYDRPVAEGRVGEIVMRGPMVFKGYWNLPDDNARTFRDGWHHTGDLGRFDEQGYLWYAGRKAEKELIKPGGENVYPAEVEKAILAHPAVEKTVVFGVPDPKWKEGIKAVCQLKSGERLDAAELIEFVGRRIARFKKPGYVEFVAELPLRQDGSLDRAAVKKLFGGSQQ
ncbi:MAG: AMP-binding protein [Desulfobacterales bacterium]